MRTRMRRAPGAAALVAATALITSVTACGSGTPAAVTPCSLLTAAEVSVRAGSAFDAGHTEVSASDQATLGCFYRSPSGYVAVWNGPGAPSGTQPAAPRCDGELERVDAAGYQAYACTTGANLQTMYVSTGTRSLTVDIGAGAPAGAARSLGVLATSRLP